MDAFAIVIATGLTAKFIYTFLYLFYVRHTLHPHEARHRVQNSERASRRRVIDEKDIVTTGDILGNMEYDLSDGFVEGLASDGGYVNSEGFKTY